MANHTQVVAQVLKRSASEDDSEPFEEVHISIEVQKDNPITIMEKLGVARGFLCYFGRISDESLTVKHWYDGKNPMVIVPVKSDYIEAAEVRSQNSAARLVDAGVPIAHAIKALGRAYWHKGFHEFSGAATNARKLVEATCRDPYNDRTELVTLDPFGELGPTGHFRENVPWDDADVILPPHAVGHLDSLQLRGLWQGAHDYRALSGEERLDIQRKGRDWHERCSFIEKSARAVVRVFGYHELTGCERAAKSTTDKYEAYREFKVDGTSASYRFVPFTAFFVSPTLLLCTRTCCYNSKAQTYASDFYWTRRVRAKHGMLREGVDLFRCKEVQNVSSFLVDKIRSIGVELTDEKVPPGNMSVAWNDLMLLEVEREHASSDYLLPDANVIKKGDDLASIYYCERPSEDWIDDVMGPKGHDIDIGLRDLMDMCWGFDIKSVALGQAKNEDENGIANHTSALVTGSCGSPVFHSFKGVTESNEAEEKEILTFCAINCGRCKDEIERNVSDIEANNTTPAAAKMAKSLNMFNTSISVSHITFILLYQQYILPEFQNKPEEAYLQKLFTPYAVFVKPDVLRACHRKMLKDAEDHNDWGYASFVNDFHKSSHFFFYLLICLRLLNTLDKNVRYRQSDNVATLDSDRGQAFQHFYVTNILRSDIFPFTVNTR